MSGILNLLSSYAIWLDFACHIMFLLSHRGSGVKRKLAPTLPCSRHRRPLICAMGLSKFHVELLCFTPAFALKELVDGPSTASDRLSHRAGLRLCPHSSRRPVGAPDNLRSGARRAGPRLRFLHIVAQPARRQRLLGGALRQRGTIIQWIEIWVQTWTSQTGNWPAAANTLQSPVR